MGDILAMVTGLEVVQMSRTNYLIVVSFYVAIGLCFLWAGICLSNRAYVPAISIGGLGCLLCAAMLGRSLRVESENAMLQVFAETPPKVCEVDQDEVTAPMPPGSLPPQEPATGVRHRTISEPPPKILSWHGKRGQS